MWEVNSETGERFVQGYSLFSMVGNIKKVWAGQSEVGKEVAKEVHELFLMPSGVYQLLARASDDNWESKSSLRLYEGKEARGYLGIPRLVRFRRWEQGMTELPVLVIDDHEWLIASLSIQVHFL